MKYLTMKQCELERVIRQKGNMNLKRTGEKLVSFVKGIKEDMKGNIIELKRNRGLWVVDKVYGSEVEIQELKRNWSISSSETN